MDRKNFLKNVGIVGLSAAAIPVIGFSHAKGLMDEPSNNDLLRTTSCTVTPGETAGPYPLPSSVSITSLIRSDITEGTQTGIPLSVTITITNADNSCAPVSGLRVDIWHCNKRGYYSAYDGQPGIDGTENYSGTTWLRGIQYTDSSGQVTFTTIYPGWYSPRATHIHVEVYNGTDLIQTTQLCFSDTLNTTVNSYYATSGTNSVTNETDMVFSDSYANETMTVTGDTTSGYVATMNVVVSAGALGIGNIEAETGGQFSKLVNYPNPFVDTTIVSFELLKQSDVKLTIMDTTGRVVKEISNNNMAKGKQEIEINIAGQLSSGTYLYQLQVTNDKGIFRQTKKMLKD